MDKIVGIYCIRFGTRFYVGQSVNVFARFKTHQFYLQKGKHNNHKLQLAYNKYGPGNWEYCLIEECDRSLLTKREQWWMDVLDACIKGFNCNPHAATPPDTRGRKLSDEHRQKLSKAGKGRKHSEETKRKIAISHTGISGQKWSEEQRVKIIQRLSGRKRPHRSEEWCRKISEGNQGKKHSAETKLKMSETHRRRKRSPCSDETKAKIAASLRQFHQQEHQIDDVIQHTD